VVDYVKNQKRHHTGGAAHDRLERILHPDGSPSDGQDKPVETGCGLTWAARETSPKGAGLKPASRESPVKGLSIYSAAGRMHRVSRGFARSCFGHRRRRLGSGYSPDPSILSLRTANAPFPCMRRAPGGLYPRHAVTSARSPATTITSFRRLYAVHAQRHSVRTFSRPRSKNCRRPIQALITAFGVSAIQARRA